MIFGIGAVKMATGAFGWAAKHVMPWAAAFLAGVVWSANRGEIKDLRAENKQMIASTAEAAGRLAALGEVETMWQADRETERRLLDRDFATLRAQLNQGDDNAINDLCDVSSAADRDRVRSQIAAANQFAFTASGVPGGVSGSADASDVD